MPNRFIKAIKSTLDKLLSDKGTALGVAYVDIDDLSGIRKVTDSTGTCLLGHLQTVEAQGNRIHSVVFGAGAKLSSDPGNYTLIGLTDQLSAMFPLNGQLAIKDWSGATVGPRLGTLIIRSVSLQNTDVVGEANARFITVNFSAYEFV